MREYIGPEVLVNTISMLASSQKGAIWISDCDEEALFYESRCANPLATVLPASYQALAVMSALKERGVTGVLATVRASEFRDEDIYSLSAGDVTTLLVMSNSCRRILEECGGRMWLSAANQVVGDLFAKVREVAYQFGSLRLFAGASSEIKNRIVNESLLEEVLDWQTLEFKDTVTDSRITRGAWSEFRSQAESLRNLSKVSTCEGEDLLIVLASVTRRFHPRGLHANRPVEAGQLWSLLRTGFDIMEFEKDDLYWSLRSWQRRNQHPVLREWRELDPLQVLLDQRYWEMDLQRVLMERPGQTVAIAKMDLDNFKQVNDALGHAAGDEAIRLFARIVKDELGRVAEVYRRGGDEVVAIATGVQHEKVSRAMSKLLISTAMRFRSWGEPQGLQETPTASIGLVLGQTPLHKGAVVAALDRAQLQAKKEGKNTIVETILESSEPEPVC
jgi:diguanylate cyclase (GGDEF)-like protein